MPEETTNTYATFEPDLENDKFLVHWLIKHLPHLAEQVMTIDEAKFKALLDDIAEKPIKGEPIKLKPAFQAMPVMFKKVEIDVAQLEDSATETTPAKDDGTITTEVIRITVCKTKYGDLYWACNTAIGNNVNIFKSRDAARDTFGFFRNAGYAKPLLDMKYNESYTWELPIKITMEPDGAWWKITGVLSSYDGTLPTLEKVPTQEENDQARREAIEWAKDMMKRTDFIVFDTETTGTGDTAEIVQFSAVNKSGEVVMNQLIKPSDEGLALLMMKDPQRNQAPMDIHGITPEMLQDAPTFDQVHKDILGKLWGNDLVAYNAQYDVRLLQQDCERHSLPQIVTNQRIDDPMLQYAKYVGEWNPAHGNYKWFRLEEAIAHEGLEVLQAHDATEDCRMTLELIKFMASQEEEQLFSPPPKTMDDIPF